MRSTNLLIGSPLERVEDFRLLRGRGQFIADINREGQYHAVILRSPVAHGLLRKIGAASGLQLPGVHAVLTARDLGPDVPVIPLRLHPLPELALFCQPVLAYGKVRYVGEPLAVVIADSQAIAEDALDLIEIDIEELPAITDRVNAAAAETVLFEDHGSNESIQWYAERGAADAAFASADYVRRETFKVQRHAALRRLDDPR